jgi:CHAT domain
MVPSEIGATNQAAPTPNPAGPNRTDVPKNPGDSRKPTILIDIHAGGMTHVESQVAVVGKYAGLDLAGPAQAFDLLLDSWLSRAVEMGMIGSDLGQLFPVHLERVHTEQFADIKRLLLMGMGPASEFSPEDARYVMRNVTIAVKASNFDEMSVPMFGIRRKELSIDVAARSFLQGILDGFRHFQEIVPTLSLFKEQVLASALSPLKIHLVDENKERALRIYKELSELQDRDAIPELEFKISGVFNNPPDKVRENNDEESDDGVATLLRVTRNNLVTMTDGGIARLSEGGNPTDRFQFSAISDFAAETVREVELSSYVVKELPKRMIMATTPQDRDDFGSFMTIYVVPDVFQNFLTGAKDVTLVLDETTASFPWELAAFEKHGNTRALARSMSVSRRFHSLLSPPPGSPPPLNDSIRILVVADPMAGAYALPHAQKEGWAIVDVLHQARKLWEGTYKITTDIHIGAPGTDTELLRNRAKYSDDPDLFDSIKPCDPLEIAKLIVKERYDIIHFAGHGIYDERTKRAGWVLDDTYPLSAQEIFRARQVPRLVFGNACFSAITPQTKNPQGQLVGLALAFFARGVPNYIGTGWQVNDDCAAECAREFYCSLLGVKYASDEKEWVKSRPSTIGRALLEGRNAAYAADTKSSTWAAYQHYGQVTDRVLCPRRVKSERSPEPPCGAPSATSDDSTANVSVSSKAAPPG